MLKNISQETLALKYTGLIVNLEPGQEMDVIEKYGASGKEASSLEDRFVCKFPQKIIKYEVPIPAVKEIEPEKPSVKSKAKKR